MMKRCGRVSALFKELILIGIYMKVPKITGYTNMQDYMHFICIYLSAYSKFIIINIIFCMFYDFPASYAFLQGICTVHVNYLEGR